MPKTTIKKDRCVIVLENTPGYLPDSPPEIFRGRGMKGEARAHARDLAAQLREEEGYVCKGSASVGYSCKRKGAAAKYDLGRVIEVHEGSGVECEDDDDAAY